MTTKNLIYTGLAVVGAVVVFNYVAKQMKKGKGISAKGSVLGTTASASVSTENNK
jgi:hypothetical protein